MDLLKKIFPIAFAPKADIKGLVTNLVIHLIGWVILYAVGIVFGWLNLPLLGTIFGLVFDIVKLYIGASAIISVLDYLKLFKD